MTTPRDSPRCLSVEFVCSGNICRSPVAEKVFRTHLADAGLADLVAVRSSGIGPWHAGEPMDERAAGTLRGRGYDTDHVARQIDPRTLESDLLITATRDHAADLIAAGADPERVWLVRSFDPAASDDPGGADLPDPYYGGPDGFDDVLAMVEAATPGIVTWVRERL